MPNANITVTLSAINPKSLDFVLSSGSYTNTMQINITSVSDPNSLIIYDVVESSVTPSTYVVVFDDTTLLTLNEYYNFTLLDGTTILYTETFQVTNFPAVINATVNTFGDRIIDVSFPYPIHNLNSADTTSSKNLYNFYASYYNKDNINAITSGGSYGWLGFFPTAAASGSTPQYFSATVSDDLKTLELQSLEKNLPIGTNHTLTINYSRVQFANFNDPNIVLIDYDTPVRQVPIMEKPFVLSSEQLPAEPIDITITSLTEILITFDKPVLIRAADSPKIYCNGVLRDVSSVERVGLDKTVLKYTLASSTPLIPGTNVRLNVKPITDASGFLTVDLPIYKDIIATPPSIVLVEQYTGAQETGITKILVRYSWDMDIGSATTIANYVLKPNVLGGSPITILSVAQASPGSKTDFILRTNELPTGSYSLLVSNVKDISGIFIVPSPVIFTINDLSVPTITSLLVSTDPTGSNSVLLAMYNDIMNVTDEHGADVPLNYKLLGVKSTNNVIYDFTTTTTITPLNGNKWMRMTLPSGFDAITFATATTKLKVGYPLLTTIRYVTNVSGNIYPLCNDRELDAIVPQIAISAGALTIKAHNTLTFTTASQNFMFNPPNITLSDFTFASGSTTLNPISATLEPDFRTITFIFPNNTFNSNTSSVTMTSIANPVTKDIFTKSIIGNESCSTLINNLSATLSGITKYSYSVVGGGVQNLSLTLLFNSSLISTDPKDFTVTNSIGSNILVANAAVNPVGYNTSNFSIVTLAVYTTDSTINLATDTLYVSSKTSNIGTYDSHNRPITPFANVLVNDYVSTSFDWKYVTSLADLKNSTFTLGLSKPVDFSKYSSTSTVTVTGSSNVLQSSSVTTSPSLYKTIINLTGTVSTTTVNLGQIAIYSTSSLVATDTTSNFTVTPSNSNSTLSIHPTSTVALSNTNTIIYADYLSSYSFIDSTDTLVLGLMETPNATPHL